MEEQRARQEDEAKKAIESTAAETAPVQETGKEKLTIGLIKRVVFCIALKKN